MRLAFVFPGQGSFRAGCLDAWDATRPAPWSTRSRTPPAATCGRWTSDAGTGARTADAQPTIMAASLVAGAPCSTPGSAPDVVAGHSLGRGHRRHRRRRAVGRRRGPGRRRTRRRHGSTPAPPTPARMAALVKLAPDAVAGARRRGPRPRRRQRQRSRPGRRRRDPRRRSAASATGPATPGAGACRSTSRARSTRPRWPPPSPTSPRRSATRAGRATPAVPLVTGDGDRRADRRRRGRRRPRSAACSPPSAGAKCSAPRGPLGVDATCVEVGPGGVLAGLARRTVPELRVRTVATPADAHALAVELGVVVDAACRGADARRRPTSSLRRPAPPGAPP